MSGDSVSTRKSADGTERRRRRTRRKSDSQNFIPLRKVDLRRALLADPIFTPPQRESFVQLCRMLEAAIHHEYHERLEWLKETYHPFDPDLDTARRIALKPEEEQRSATEFFETFIDLLDRANFQHLAYDDVSRALDQASQGGFNLEVEFNVFQRLEIFVRGDDVIQKSGRGPWPWQRKKLFDTPVYRRLVLLFRLRDNPRLPQPVDTRTIFIKVFKDVPKHDLDMLLPGSRVRMTWLDQSKILIPTLSGIAIALVKIIQGALVLAFAGIYAILALIAGTIGYGMKSFYTYLNTKDKYQLTLTRNLYYQFLDGNSGVFHRLLDEAEEQEFREVVIAYFLLWKNADSAGWSIEQLDLAAEQFLLDQSGVQIDFEICDALEKLAAMKLVVPAPGGKWRAVQLDRALSSLDETWDALFAFGPCSSPSLAPHFFRAAPPEYPVDADDWGPLL